MFLLSHMFHSVATLSSVQAFASSKGKRMYSKAMALANSSDATNNLRRHPRPEGQNWQKGQAQYSTIMNHHQWETMSIVCLSTHCSKSLDLEGFSKIDQCHQCVRRLSHEQGNTKFSGEKYEGTRRAQVSLSHNSHQTLPANGRQTQRIPEAYPNDECKEDIQNQSSWFHMDTCQNRKRLFAKR